MSAPSAERVWVNGQPVDPASPALSVDDRGLQYGDGLFETMLLQKGKIRFLDDHLGRLRAGCQRLGMAAPDLAGIAAELEQLTAGYSQSVLKLVITRGAGGRGYRPPADLRPTRIASLQAFNEPTAPPHSGLKLRWCKTRLARSPLLAGMKHLNRLEQVLAQMEPADPDVSEGLMLDTEGELIGGTFHNVFMLIEGVLVTPDLRYSGVQGVMRKNVIAAAARIGVTMEERAVWPAELALASEVFVTNAVRGLRVVGSLDEQQWHTGPVARALADELGLN